MPHRRIQESITAAREAGARLRLGPELEIPGYGCEDPFLEDDTPRHSWEVLALLLKEGWTKDLLCDFGMPVLHAGAHAPRRMRPARDVRPVAPCHGAACSRDA